MKPLHSTRTDVWSAMSVMLNNGPISFRRFLHTEVQEEEGGDKWSGKKSRWWIEGLCVQSWFLFLIAVSEYSSWLTHSFSFYLEVICYMQRNVDGAKCVFVISLWWHPFVSCLCVSKMNPFASESLRFPVCSLQRDAVWQQMLEDEIRIGVVTTPWVQL